MLLDCLSVEERFPPRQNLRVGTSQNKSVTSVDFRQQWVTCGYSV